MMKLLLFSALPVLVAASSSPSVTIDAGTLQGGRCDTSDAVFYKSIPFAEPPVGDLRFEPPQQYNKTYPDGILNATIRAPSCVQFGSELVPAGAQQEDCLYLDLWAPSNASADSKLPVKVWVFGGSHASSGISYALYDGCNIVDDGSIYVGLNYRMGPLGYMALDKTGVSGNQGIKDILLGLEWIQRNIAAFGGDPKKVLLFGQSSGAEDIFTISTLAQAPSLINGVVAESGGGRNIADKKVLQRLAVSYARDLQCSPTNVECLKSKSVDELKKANSNNTLLSTGIGHDGDIGLSNSKTSQWYPTVDGKLITEQPVSRGSRVPIIFGSNQQEGTTYAFEQFIDYPATITPSGYKSFLRKNFGGAAQMVEKYYPLSKFETLTQPIAQELHLNKTVHTAFAVIEAMSVVITDYDYKCSAYQGALVTSQNGVPSWTYEFTHNSSCPWLDTQTLLTKEMGISWSAMTEIVGATHTSEIPYLFGNLYDQPMQSGSCNATKSELQLSAQMRSLWTAMAENGSPSTDAIHWHEFQKQGNGSLTPGVTFENLTVSGTIDYSVCELWLKVYQYLESSNSTATPTPSRGSASATASPSSTPTQYSIAAATVPESIFGLRLAFLLIGLAMVW